MGFARRKRYKYKSILLITGSILVVSIIVGFTYYSVKRYKKDVESAYITQIEAFELENYLQLKDVFIPNEYIPNGTLITEELLTPITITSSLDQSIYFTKEDIGTFALIGVEPGLPLMKVMITKENLANDIRSEEFNIFALPTQLNKNEFIDVRINFPNGEDYIVLSKKKVREVDLEMNTVWLWLSEKEILDISSAVIDAYIHQGSRLYTTLYVEPAIQEAAVTTYPPNADVLQLIEENPNILEEAKTALLAEARFYLEERLSGISPVIPWETEAVDEAINEDSDSVETNQEEAVDMSEPLEEVLVVDSIEEGVVSNDSFFD